MRALWRLTIAMLAVGACGGEEPPPCMPAGDGMQVVGPAGGVVSLGEVSFRFPPGALASCQAFVANAVPVPGAPEQSAVQIGPEVELARSVIIQMPGDAAQLAIGQWQPAGDWSPLLSITSPDRRQVLARARRLGSFGLGPKPAPMCRLSCGGDVVGSWELQALCTPRLLIDRRCPASSAQVLTAGVATLDGQRFRQEFDAGPMTVFAPRSCLPALQVARCEQLAALLDKPDATASCSEISETECGCSVEFRGELGRGEASGTYAVVDDEILLTGSRVESGVRQTMTAEPMPYCREGGTLSLFVNLTAVQVMRPLP